MRDYWDLDWPIEETSHPGQESVLEAPALVVVIVVRIIVVALLVARVVIPGSGGLSPLAWADITLSSQSPQLPADLTCSGQPKQRGQREPDHGDQGYRHYGAYEAGANLTPGLGVG